MSERLAEVYSGVAPTLKSRMRSHQRRRAVTAPSSDDLDDAVQEAFCRALQAMKTGRYDARRAVLPYLTAICCHVLTDMARLRRKEGRHCSDAAVASPEEDVGPTAAEAFPEHADRVGEWMSGQPAAIRALCHRRFWVGESQRAAARALRLSRQQVRTLEEQVRASLAQYLGVARP